MKKIFLIIFLFGLVLSGLAQNKKSLKKSTEIDEVKSKVSFWFKSLYVEINFKDPASYKLIKVDASPVTQRENIKGIISMANYRISMLDTSLSYGDYQVKYKEYLSAKIDHDRTYRNSNDTMHVKESLNQVNFKLSEANEVLRKYTKAKEDKNTCEEALKTLTPAELDKIETYKIFLDCYANNSYGLRVLNEYVFEVNREGNLIGDIRLLKD